MPKKSNRIPIEYIHKWTEWKIDPVKWAEECVYLPSVGGSQKIKFYEPQKRILRAFYKSHYLVLNKTRQTGFSTLFQIIAAHISVFYENVKMGILSRKGDEATDFNRKTMFILDNLEYEWLKPKYTKKSEQSFELQNGCALYSSAVSKENPSSVFRGKSLAVLFLDEAAFIPKVNDVWTGVTPALSKAQLDAERNGIPYGTAIISTPNKKSGIGEWYYKMWTNAEADPENSIFKAHRIHWKEIPDFVNDPTWYERQRALLEYNEERIAQELELEFIGSEEAFFKADTQRALNTIKNPETMIKIKTEISGDLWLLDEIIQNNFYIISVDSASASGSDYSTIQVMNLDKFCQTMEYKGKPEPILFAKIVKKVADMFPNNIIIVENTGGYGQSVLNELMFDEDKNYNLYGENRTVLDVLKNKKVNKFVTGLNTNTATRQRIIDALFTVITENPFQIKSERTALELLSLVEKKNKIQADIGFNDDLAMAWGFICYLIKYDIQYISDVKSNCDNLMKVKIKEEKVPEENKTKYSERSLEEMIQDMNKDDRQINQILPDYMLNEYRKIENIQRNRSRSYKMLVSRNKDTIDTASFEFEDKTSNIEGSDDVDDDYLRLFSHD